MRKLAFIGLLTVATCLFTYPVSAAGESRDQHPAPTQQLYSLANGQNSGFTTGASVLQGKAQGDTIYLLGGPNRDDGDFESATSGCDWDGWTTADLTVAAESVWHCSDYHCDNLDPDTVPNHAWWCGMMYNHDCETGDYGGYGNIWTEWLDWYGTVPDNSLPAIVTVSAMLNYDVDRG